MELLSLENIFLKRMMIKMGKNVMKMMKIVEKLMFFFGEIKDGILMVWLRGRAQ